MVNEFLIRFGTFCILLGIGILMLFVASDSSGGANFDYLFWAVLCVTLGALLRRRKAPNAPSGRFAALHGLKGRGHKNREDQ